ncbi:hypothetical protein BaRGS_00027901, partial [Batillaria attramentaria]
MNCALLSACQLLLLALVPLARQQSLEKDIVVVGGGISGLAAARQILNRGGGNFSVRVYEARRERYGGRVWTNRLKHPKARGLEVDLGGSALNVLNRFANPLLNLTSDFGLETVTLGNAAFVVPWQGKRYSGEELTNAMMQAGNILMEAINTTRIKKRDVSVRQAVNQQLKEKGVSDDNLQTLLLKTLPSYVIEEYSALLYQPDSLDFGYDQMLLDGMGELLDRLASGMEDERPLKISLRTAVRQIKVDSTPFWSDDHDVYIVAAERDSERGNLQTWLNLHRVLGKPVLVGMVMDQAGSQIEALSDEDLRVLVTEKLSSVFGEDVVSAATITKILRSSWTSDQWSGGSSTYPRVGNTPDLWDTLAEPLCPYIYFAGEHTTYKGHGSLHGAYLSGLRAADQLLSGYCEEK